MKHAFWQVSLLIIIVHYLEPKKTIKTIKKKYRLLVTVA